MFRERRHRDLARVNGLNRFRLRGFSVTPMRLSRRACPPAPPVLAQTNKSLAKSNKSLTGAKATKKTGNSNRTERHIGQRDWMRSLHHKRKDGRGATIKGGK
jgi:hypothetical protein